MVSLRTFADSNIDPRIRAGLVGCWLGGRLGGGTWFDCSGYSNHGSFVNSPTLADEGLSLDGAGACLGVPDVPNFDFSTGAVTLSVLFKLRSLASTQGLVTRWQCGANTNTEFQFFFNSADGKLYLTTWDGTNAYNTVGATSLQADTWLHASASYDNATLGSALYLNGVLDGSATATGSGPLVNGTYPLRIGARDCGGVAADMRLNGIIRRVLVHRRALSGAEVAMIASPSFSPIIGGGPICGL